MRRRSCSTSTSICPRGSQKEDDKSEWKIAASAATVSAAKVVLGREGAIDELKKTSDCKSCYDKFK